MERHGVLDSWKKIEPLGGVGGSSLRDCWSLLGRADVLICERGLALLECFCGADNFRPPATCGNSYCNVRDSSITEI